MFDVEQMVKSVQDFLENSEKRIKGEQVEDEKCTLTMPFDGYDCVVSLVGGPKCYKVQMDLYDNVDDSSTSESKPSKSVKSELCFSGNRTYYAPTAPINTLKMARGLGTYQLLFGEIECIAAFIKTKNKYQEIWDFVSANRKAILKSNVKFIDLAEQIVSGDKTLLEDGILIEKFAYNYNSENSENKNGNAKPTVLELTQKAYEEWLEAKSAMEENWDKETPHTEPKKDEYNEPSLDEMLNEDKKCNWLVRAWRKFVGFLKRLFGKKDKKNELDELWEDDGQNEK